jgi:hypothetical protein
MTRTQIGQLFLRSRDAGGNLDLEELLAEDEVTDQADNDRPEPPSLKEQRQHLRRMQGFPEYLIDKELETLEDNQPITYNQPR